MSDPIKDKLAAQIADAVAQKIGGTDAAVRNIVAEEIGLAFGTESARGLWSAAQQASEGEPEPERVVVTANGKNRPGIVARVTSAIDEMAGDIRDISQTIVGDYFTMLIVVDIAAATRQGTRFAQLRQRLKDVGDDLGVHVVALHDDILSSMHRV